MRKRVIVFIAMVLLCVFVYQSPVSAEGNYGANTSSNHYTSDDNPFHKVHCDGQCTWYAWGRAREKNGISLSWGNGVNLGDAGTWLSKAAGQNYSTGTTPKSNSIACWPVSNGMPYGHVAYVERVSGNLIYISEYNFNISLKYTESTINISTGERTDTYPEQKNTYVSAKPTGYIYLGVYIDSNHFPDSNFRNCVKKFDSNGDGALSSAEIKAVKEIYCSDCDISSLKGIELFTNLEYLECSGNELKSLDLEKNTKLQTVYCEGCELTSLKISKNTKLKYLFCSCNNLSKLDLFGNKNLVHLECNSNNLTKLQLDNNSKLLELECIENKLKTLDVTPCPYLKEIVQKLKRESEKDFDYFDSKTSKAGLGVDRTVTVIAGKTISEPTIKYISNNKLKYKLSIPDKTAILTGVTDEKIKTIIIPDTIKNDGKTFKVVQVAPNACKGLVKLENVGFGKNIKTIGKNAFNGCKKLKSISFSGTSLKKVGSNAFKGIAAKAKFTCEKKILASYKKLIKNGNPPSSVKYNSNKGSGR